MEAQDCGDDAKTFISVAKLYRDIRLHSQIKDLLLAVAFIANYISFSYHRFDPVWGHETKEIYDTGIDQLGGIPAAENSWCNDDTRMTYGNTEASCWWEYQDIEKLQDMSFYFSNRLSKLAPEIHGVCPDCMLAVSNSPDNIYSLDVRDYVCADFASDDDTNNYPARDCTTIDREWVTNPRSYSTPCCRDTKLMQYSLLMMAWQYYQDVDGYLDRRVAEGKNGTLDHMDFLFQANDTDGIIGENGPSEGATCNFSQTIVDNRVDLDDVFYCFLYANINSAGHFMQVMISRRERIMGINYDAELRDKSGWDTVWVIPTVRLWSFRFDNVERQRWWTGIWSFFLIWYVLHALMEVIVALSIWGPWQPRKLFSHRSFYSCPALFMPLILEVLKPRIAMPDFNIAVTLVELVLLVVFLVHLEAIDLARVIVKIVTNAFQQMTIFIFILVPLWIAVGTMYSQMFGVYKYKGFASALHDLFTVFANGQEVDEADYTYGPTAFWLMYYASAFILVLTLSQVFITILMDSYAASKEEEDVLKRQVAMPEGFAVTGRRYTWIEAILEIGSVALLDYSHRLGDWNRRLAFGLEKAMEDPGEPLREISQFKLPETSRFNVLTVSQVRTRLHSVGCPARAAERIKEHYSIGVADAASAAAVEEDAALAELRASVLTIGQQAGYSWSAEELRGLPRSGLHVLQRGLEAPGKH